MAKKVLFVNQEISPYVPDNEMSIMGRVLPQKVQEANYEIRTFMPKWGEINERRGQLHEVIRLSGMNLIIDDTDHPLIIKVASIPTARVQVYFIDNEDYFPKHKLEEDDEEQSVNVERAIFFARGVLETVKKLRWAPDLIVCQGWMSSLIPLYIKLAYDEEPSFANTKIVTALYNNLPGTTLGSASRKFIEYKGVTSKVLSAYKSKFDYKELTKIAIDYSDSIIEMSGNMNRSISTYLKDKDIPILNYKEDNIDEIKQFLESQIQ